ncbi:MAG: nitroreductase [bacterium]|nr:nitroreductase [bacterium]
MDAIECINSRMSIRKFRSEPVPKEILAEIIETAQRSPSYKNSQPWEIALLSGEKKAALSKLLIHLFESGKKASPDIPEPSGWPNKIEMRIKESLEKRSKCFGINLLDPENISRSKKANFCFYGAPHGLFFFQDASLNEWSIFDMGLFVQSIMLAANAKGLGTVPQAYLIDYSEEIRNFLGITDSKRLVLGMSIGYPDMEDRLNSYTTEREPINNVVRWLE